MADRPPASPRLPLSRLGGNPGHSAVPSLHADSPFRPDRLHLCPDRPVSSPSSPLATAQNAVWASALDRLGARYHPRPLYRRNRQPLCVCLHLPRPCCGHLPVSSIHSSVIRREQPDRK